MGQKYEREQAAAVRAVQMAARVCQAVRGELAPGVLDKQDKSPVTVADFASQAVICRALQEAFPDDAIIAEEDSAELKEPRNASLLQQVVAQLRAAGLSGDGELSESRVCDWIDLGGVREFRDRFWTIDPIDGTKGFLRNEQYAVALALIVEGQVVVAALACPNLSRSVASQDRENETSGVILSAVRGQGAFARSPGDETRGSKIRVSGKGDPVAGRFCESVESGHSAHGDAAAIASRLGMTADPLRMDSQAKYAVIARGDAEVYLRMPTRADYREKIWDHAAGALLVEEAGGTVTDIAGRPLEFHHGRELAANRGVVVTNGLFHGPVIETIHDLGLVK